VEGCEERPLSESQGQDAWQRRDGGAIFPRTQGPGAWGGGWLVLAFVPGRRQCSKAAEQLEVRRLVAYQRVRRNEVGRAPGLGRGRQNNTARQEREDRSDPERHLVAAGLEWHGGGLSGECPACELLIFIAEGPAAGPVGCSGIRWPSIYAFCGGFIAV